MVELEINETCDDTADVSEVRNAIDNLELAESTAIGEAIFAGHPLVGTAWLLEREGRGGLVLRPPAAGSPAS